ncbi:ATP-binding cassette domain-containing protein [Streptosporangium saharense]|uniref:ATP-binding cassette domain-containing protein n=1 Tax=Streptosporangium saharense TaxID=1706840 RepID=UPI0036BCDDA3
MSGPLLEAEGLVKRFLSGTLAVDGVDLTVNAGETVGLVGESGSGKSTTARLVLRLLRPDAGTVRFAGHDLLRLPERRMRPLRARIQFVPQSPRTSLNPRLRAGESVAFNLRAHGLPVSRVPELLERVGLGAEHAARYPAQLSGGQAQRVAIARALATEPDLVVCDEPVSALDRSVQARVLNLLARLQQETGVAYLFVSHDLAVVEHLCDRALVMREGRVVERGPTRELWRSPRHPYTRSLLAAVRPLTGELP